MAAQRNGGLLNRFERHASNQHRVGLPRRLRELADKIGEESAVKCYSDCEGRRIATYHSREILGKIPSSSWSRRSTLHFGGSFLSVRNAL